MPENSIRQAKFHLAFVDTNILVYAHDHSAKEKHRLSTTLLKELWETATGCLSVQVLQEFYVTITAKVKRPLSAETAAEIISMLSLWKIHTPDVQDVLRAIAIQRQYQISFWDAMIIQSAVKLGCQVLWSEDLHAGQIYAGVTVKNPFI